MNRFCLHFTLPLLGLAACDAANHPQTPARAPAKELPELARRMGRAMGLDAWRGLERLGFTWKHLPSGRIRSYEWRPRKRTVMVRTGTIQEGQVSQEVPSGPLPSDASDSERRLHQAWVNDSYWVLFALLIFDDGSHLADLGEANVPGFSGLGSTRALEVRYPADEGYTGGDRYVLYIGEDDLPVAWAFHRGGSDKPTLVTTRGPRRRANGISFPVRFEKADGTILIAVADVTAEPARD